MLLIAASPRRRAFLCWHATSYRRPTLSVQYIDVSANVWLTQTVAVTRFTINDMSSSVQAILKAHVRTTNVCCRITQISIRCQCASSFCKASAKNSANVFISTRSCQTMQNSAPSSSRDIVRWLTRWELEMFELSLHKFLSFKLLSVQLIARLPSIRQEVVILLAHPQEA